ncbi:6-phospho-3-hexuloisomerase [Glutamicibacter sp. JL.03c]|uniref:6-phospho-3-hexuloisomerase n=1 Tax=Glutamicibacter sp. JL.03c TaxID=2984842 RepID=UPI0021F6F653|nr:6-phospho-3-hexuloisomerase [Glutamicibacter sp. JL.03c]UYQ77104.1 6-phospho-3-hexuloisomerase [Glutamicibacter sp. JL.03c]
MSAAPAVSAARVADESVLGAREVLLAELATSARAVEASQAAQAARMIGGAPRVFLAGAGRSGLVLRMAAMRFMHLGLRVHVVGETTTPAIRADDLLVVASGSGSTSGVVKSAETAAKTGAQILAVTTDGGSPLANLATTTVLVPAVRKTDHVSSLSEQYSGSLFEQSLFVLIETIFHILWKTSDATAEELWMRHANLE